LLRATLFGRLLAIGEESNMNPEIATIDHDGTSSPHAQEVEFALILARMINTAKQDPAQLRFTVYEFARSKLEDSISWADEDERKRLLGALEVAIKGVEQFSERADQSEQLQAPEQSAPMALGLGGQTNNRVAVIATDPRVFTDARWKPLAPPMAERKEKPAIRSMGRIAGALLLAGAVAGAVVLYLTPGYFVPAPTLSEPKAALPADVKPVPQPPNPPPFPIPTDYGIYVLNNGTLSELDALPERVPDKRVAVSTPVMKASRTSLPDGHARFVAFRRDLAGTAPERVDVRVVAQVTRALTFDAKGKASYSPVSGEWSIRNTAYEFRVRPIPGHPEMLLIQPENADFTLPAGRYVLSLNNQGYDFTVAGRATDPSQCLERTDAANGTFYSDCQKP
jgi:hypothetical protein